MPLPDGRAVQQYRIGALVGNEVAAVPKQDAGLHAGDVPLRIREDQLVRIRAADAAAAQPKSASIACEAGRPWWVRTRILII
ncbi:MAG: hypothetical protein MZV65_48040 [Chromatiales bacterium]|nr:hypothetical protein [Chromatiales bacterium]